MGYEAYNIARDSTLRAGAAQRAEMDDWEAQRTRKAAGNALAGGDYAGAANAMFEGGELQGGLAVQGAERNQQAADRDQQRSAIAAAVSGLLHVPEAERAQVFQQRIAPVFQQIGLGEYISQIQPDDLSDASLRALSVSMGGEVEAPFANDRSGPNGSVLRPDRYTGEYAEAYSAPFDPRAGASPGYMWTDETRTAQRFIPGGQADPSVAGGLAASRRAPPRARASGGGGGGHSPRPSGGGASSGGGLPAGFTVRRR